MKMENHSGMHSPTIIESIEQYCHTSVLSETIQKFYAKRKVDIAIRNLGSAEYKDRIEAVQLLKNLGAQAILPLQETILTTADPKVRERARRSLDLIQYRIELLKA